MAEAVLQTHNLTKQFIKRRGLSSPRHAFDKVVFTAVNNVNLTVNRGEIFGLLGPNGAGKTTLTKLLCTLILPTRGEASICGYDLRSQQGKIKSSIALISSEERSFYWRLSGRENLRFFAALYGLSRSGAEKRIPELLDLLLHLFEPHLMPLELRVELLGEGLLHVLLELVFLLALGGLELLGRATDLEL